MIARGNSTPLVTNGQIRSCLPKTIRAWVSPANVEPLAPGQLETSPITFVLPLPNKQFDHSVRSVISFGNAWEADKNEGEFQGHRHICPV